MCGVVGLVYGKANAALGEEAAALLRKLEYRGYDSTGAAFLDADGQVTLEKRVGAPSQVIQQLELEKRAGQRFIGQVRWATYGSVTNTNAQPHEVHCRLHLVGAHNGNISNTDQLKEFLAEHHHQVRSDNDGEMLVHVVEHEYDELARERPPADDAAKIALVIDAIRRTQHRVEGSYAACLAFPDLPGVFAIKAGSSLYAGQGSDAHGAFVVVSSDLTSVLSKTRFLIPLSEGEGLYFTEDDYRVFSLTAARESKPGLRRSRLNVADVTLKSRYRFFMHQEIYSTGENLDRLIQYYFPEEHEDDLFRVFEAHRPACKEIVFELLRLYDIFERPALEAALGALLEREDFRALQADARPALDRLPPVAFNSDEALLLGELLELDPRRLSDLWLLDRVIVWKKKRKVTWFRNELTGLIRRCKEQGGRVFAIGAGTSYHASLVGATFFNSIAGLAIVPVNPGQFRSMYLNALTDHDVLIGVTQSGETKDLLDIFNDVRRRYGEGIRLVSLVNNELSTIPQEKSDFFLPILCGPEIAVAATKSFISQLALFHTLACASVMPLEAVRAEMLKVKSALDFTLRSVEEVVSEVALKLFLKPSIHILGTSLIGMAKEGALKVREVVLNHCEGYDSADFKHGPNTILGKNTIYSLSDLERVLSDAFHFFQEVCEHKFNGPSGGPKRLEDMLELFKGIGFRDFDPGQALAGEELADVEDVHARYREHVNLERYFSNYPLIFLCAPVERDVKITISQIHTHKIRGADIILIAQDDEDLRKAIEGRPAAVQDYYSRYVRVPKLFDANLYPYQVAVVLQLLAFDMSIAKMKYLNKHHVENHGVHPDVPKNVSKSITVD